MSAMNGIGGTQGTNTAKVEGNINTTVAWTTITQYLPSRDADTNFWWKYSGLDLALMLEEADYSLDKQIEALVFFYHLGVSHKCSTKYLPTDNVVP